MRLRRPLSATLWAVLGVIAATPLMAAPAAEEPPPSHSVLDDQPAAAREPVRAEQALAARDWETARTALLAEIGAELQTGRRPTVALAVVLAKLAVAEAGLGRLDEARWHWGVAQNLANGPAVTDISPYGAPGELLAASPLRAPGVAPAGLEVHALHSSPRLAAPHRLQGGEIDLQPLQPGEPPLWMPLELIVDAEGAVREPVVLASNSVRLSYEILEAVHGWRYEPARLDDRPVAAFLTVEINPPQGRPLRELAPSARELAKIEELLRAGRWRSASERVEQLWNTALHKGAQTPQAFALLFALRALAEAGEGQNSLAICHWQAAQGLAPALFHAGLTDYGDAGALLAAHRWQQAERRPADPAAQAAPTTATAMNKPEILARAQPVMPVINQAQKASGTVLIESVIDPSGNVRLPFYQPATPTAPAALNFAASTMDALCRWRFKPAMAQGRPIAVYYALTMNFQVGGY